MIASANWMYNVLGQQEGSGVKESIAEISVKQCSTIIDKLDCIISHEIEQNLLKQIVINMYNSTKGVRTTTGRLRTDQKGMLRL